ncbi:MAG TPA: cytochrome c [Thermoanaerobaculia bacterium]|nr:cytochrome c [Thermoanaerobaculia bacterium]
MKLLGGVLLGFLVVAVGAGVFIETGSFNVAASSPPGKLEETLARRALNRSVARRAPARQNPLTSSAEVLREGRSHYRENCVGCHGAPGVDAAEYGEGLNPPAPDLTLPRVQRRPDGELHWIVANGIRMTGMPAFAPSHKEQEIWEIVAFLRHLPELSPEEERELKSAVEAQAEHHRESPAASAEAESGKPAHTAPPGSKPHKD